MINQVEDLEVYKSSYKLALEIHGLTIQFPKEEKYELGSQMRRASKSVPTNIREGFGRKKSPAEYRRFLNIARSSCDEMITHLDFVRDLDYITVDLHNIISDRYRTIGKQLTNLIKAWSKF